MLLRLSIVGLALAACDGRAVVGTEGEAEAQRPIDAALPDVAADSPRNDAGCACPEIAAPVCGTNGLTYDNLCFAQCVGAPVACTSACPCPDTCGACVSNADCYPGQVCNAPDVCLSWCDCPTCDVCAGHCIAPTSCALLDCPPNYGCKCGGPGPGPHLCQCGLVCAKDIDCTDPRQDTCCDTSCTDNCTCYCR